MMQMLNKTCTKCKKEYPATTENFYVDKRHKDGLCSECRTCHYKYRRTEKSKEQHQKYHKEHYRTIKGYLWRVFNNMKQRCTDPRHFNYRRYGGRGIRILFESVEEFIDYVVNDLGYDTYNKIKGLQIDRIDNDGHYEKGNIRFVTAKENSNNRG